MKFLLEIMINSYSYTEIGDDHVVPNPDLGDKISHTIMLFISPIIFKY